MRGCPHPQQQCRSAGTNGDSLPPVPRQLCPVQGSREEPGREERHPRLCIVVASFCSAKGGRARPVPAQGPCGRQGQPKGNKALLWQSKPERHREIPLLETQILPWILCGAKTGSPGPAACAGVVGRGSAAHLFCCSQVLMKGSRSCCPLAGKPTRRCTRCATSRRTMPTSCC